MDILQNTPHTHTRTYLIRGRNNSVDNKKSWVYKMSLGVTIIDVTSNYPKRFRTIKLLYG